MRKEYYGLTQEEKEWLYFHDGEDLEKDTGFYLEEEEEEEEEE